MTTAISHEASKPGPASESFSSVSMVVTLGGLAALSGLLLAVTFQATAGRIQRNKAAALEAAVFTVLPGANEQRAFQVHPDGTLAPVQGTDSGGERLYAGYADGAFVGVALSASAQGYGDVVRVLYGYDPVGEKIVGYKVLENKETPGLGDWITKAPFTDNFNGLDVTLNPSGAALVHPIETVKNGQKQHPWQIDGISGATISSKAVGRALRESTDRLLPIVKKQLTVLQGEQ